MVYILLPVHNRREITRQFIQYLKAQTFQQYHLVLIDDGSLDGTALMVAEELPAATILGGNGRLWWAGSLQKGFEWLSAIPASDSDIILIMNDDTEFDENFIETGVSLLQKSSEALLLPWCYDSRDGRLIDCGVHIDWDRLEFRQAQTKEEINCLSTRGLFLRFGDFRETGGFRPRILPHYLSDYEFTTRAHYKGKNLITDQNLTLRVDSTATGLHNVIELNLFEFIFSSFTVKCAQNPFYFSSFVLYSGPSGKKLKAFCKVWTRFFKHLYAKSINRWSNNFIAILGKFKQF